MLVVFNVAAVVPSRFANAMPTSDAVKALLAVKVRPLTVTDSPLASGEKVSVAVDLVPSVVTELAATAPCEKVLVGAFAVPLLALVEETEMLSATELAVDCKINTWLALVWGSNPAANEPEKLPDALMAVFRLVRSAVLVVFS